MRPVVHMFLPRLRDHAAAIAQQHDGDRCDESAICAHLFPHLIPDDRGLAPHRPQHQDN